jgi:CheY-like chemotaxis protein
MTRVPSVLFIDDDRRLIQLYAEAVKVAGLDPQCTHNPDDALEYLRADRPAEVIIWDMMMLPGREFANVDTEGGLSTGRFLYEKMRMLRPDAVFVLLTNQPYDPDEFEHPEIRSYARFKPDTSPEDLASLVEVLLKNKTEV